MSLISSESAEDLEGILLEGAKKIESSEVSNQKDADILRPTRKVAVSQYMSGGRKKSRICVPILA
jgi:hypothetical protein